MNETPLQLGYTMPPEWEKHSAVWMAWPYLMESFEGHLEKVEKTYVNFISALHKYETIKLLVTGEDMELRVRMILGSAGIDMTQVVFYQVDYADVWLRDFGPVFVKKESELAWVKLKYDAYGNKFEALLKDDKVFHTLKNEVRYQMFDADFVMEGGAFDVNGKGSLLTTKQCLLENRNKNKTQEDSENILKEMLGVKNIIWLNQGLTNDHTDGHIDEVARFVSPTKILCAYEENEQDENYQILKENFEILENAVGQDGNKFEVVKLPMPHMLYEDGVKAPVSYANFYIGNKVVIMSTFADVNDPKAMKIIQDCFPDRDVVGIDCRDLIYGGGALHCITQQEPK
ncbi:MAG: agmatine deiminase family protein [Patescibacteria group bacterium]